MTAAAAPNGIAQRAIGWAMRHMELLFRIARNTVPILVVSFRGQRFALVTRYADVIEVFAQPNVFDVVYAPKIRVIMDGDNFFLGMNDCEEATRDKTTMRMTMPRAEAMTRVGPAVAALADEVMAAAAPAGRVDLAMELSQAVTTRFLGTYFGTPGADATAFSDQARLLFDYMFADLSNDPALDARARPAAAALRDYVDGCIAARRAARGEAAAGASTTTHDDILERCLELHDGGAPGLDDRGIRKNLMGMIIGGLPQPPMLIPQLFDVLLDRPAELAAAQAAARAGDTALVARHVFEAARFYPLAPGLFRDCTADYRLAGGTWHATTIRRGTRVFAATRSAMFDGRRVADPTRYRTDRPDYHYLQFGYGAHECFGIYMNREIVPAICAAVLKRPGLRRAAGDAGRLRMDGIFAMNLTVEFDPA